MIDEIDQAAILRCKDALRTLVSKLDSRERKDCAPEIQALTELVALAERSAQPEAPPPEETWQAPVAEKPSKAKTK